MYTYRNKIPIQDSKNGGRMNVKNQPAGGVPARIEAALMSVSALAMMAIMLIVVTDVTGRYLFAAPLTWSYDMIGLYLMVAVFFLALPDTLSHHGHIAVDVFQPLMPAWLRHLSLGLAYLVSALIMALIGWGGWYRFSSAWANDDRIASTLALPTWVPYAMVALGSATMVVRCLLRAWGHGSALVTGQAAEGLEPPPHSNETEGHA